jgi:23S rRNA (cytidine1920-2'-O)/16S rRNA (cytidine1409-2'-O)-methyltransferase
MERPRLDALLVARGLARSREQARGLILAGSVLVDGRKVDKAGTAVAEAAEVRILTPPSPYVSRGGEKLAGALDHFAIDPAGLFCIDIGISTGGFTDCLLRRGARRVVGIDVGYGQVALILRDDPRVVLHERTNIRRFDATEVPERADLVVIDVSFISLDLVLPTAKEIARAGGTILALVKPQFEVGKGEVGKGGVVRDAAKHEAVLDKVEAQAALIGLVPRGRVASVLLGPKGNREFFVRLERP